MYGYFCIGFTDFMLKGKGLLEYTNLFSPNNTRAIGSSFYPIFNKRFDQLETFLTIHRPKKVLLAGSLCGFLVPSPQSKFPKGPSCYPESIMLQFQICYNNHLNVS